MNYDTYIRKLTDAKTKSCLENAYSHIIYQLFDDVLDYKKYSLVDTSTLHKGANNALAPKNIVACPDFVITTSDFDYKKDNNSKKSLGCIEVKFADKDVADKTRLYDDKDSIGYLSMYKKVIYTNGWIWNFYLENDQCETIDLTQGSNDTFGKLLMKLCSIDWGQLEETQCAKI